MPSATQYQFTEPSIEERLSRLEERILALCRLAERVGSSQFSSSSASSSTTPPPNEDYHYRPYTSGQVKLRKRDLERACLPLFRTQPSPPQAQLLRVVAELEATYQQHDRKQILSAVRLWFRKKREESSARINSILSGASWLEELVQAVQLRAAAPLDGHSLIRELMTMAASNRELIMQICQQAQLDIEDQNAAASFCLQKIEGLYRKKLSISSTLF